MINENESPMRRAIAVFPRFDEGEGSYNRHIIFRETLPTLKGAVIRIAAADLYRLTVNGTFVSHGPARAARGYARVDEYELTSLSRDGDNEILIEVAGYRCTAFYTPKQPSFLAAEVELDGEIKLCTDRDFVAYTNVKRVRKTERISVQRHFAEVYDERVGESVSPENRTEAMALPCQPTFIPRRAPMPTYEPQLTFGSADCYGSYTEGDIGATKRPVYFDYGKAWDFFDESEVERSNFRYISAARLTKEGENAPLPRVVSQGEWICFGLDSIEVGFIKLALESVKESDVIVAFTENPEGDFTPGAFNMQTTVGYKLPEGCLLDTESFEVYSFKKIAVFVVSGEIILRSVGLRGYVRSTEGIEKRSFRHPELQTIYDAAVRSFSHNSVDIYMDCPSRERAGWLCDSFFSARAEYFLYGSTEIEDVFLENYRLYENDGVIPEGALPMCYPADYGKDGGFIPQWVLWYVLEVGEYLTVRAKERDREPFRRSVLSAMDFFARYENGDGLLERLPGWNFVEWSDANKWCRDVNYPTNFLYSAALDTAAELYSLPELHEKAQRVRALTEERAFNGEVFVDNAQRGADGALVNTENVSEAGQYYAAIFGKIDLTDKKYARLAEYIENGFEGYEERSGKLCRINAFIGLYLRVMLLHGLGNGKALRKTVVEHCLPMARATGTLWENKDTRGSLNHGFASYLATALPLADEKRCDE